MVLNTHQIVRLGKLGLMWQTQQIIPKSPDMGCIDHPQMLPRFIVGCDTFFFPFLTFKVEARSLPNQGVSMADISGELCSQATWSTAPKTPSAMTRRLRLAKSKSDQQVFMNRTGWCSKNFAKLVNKHLG